MCLKSCLRQRATKCIQSASVPTKPILDNRGNILFVSMSLANFAKDYGVSVITPPKARLLGNIWEFPNIRGIFSGSVQYSILGSFRIYIGVPLSWETTIRVCSFWPQGPRSQSFLMRVPPLKGLGRRTRLITHKPEPSLYEESSKLKYTGLCKNGSWKLNPACEARDPLKRALKLALSLACQCVK